MADLVEFEDYSVKVKAVINDTVIGKLYDVAGELTSQAARNTPVDTGQLRDSWSYKVDEGAGEAVVGSPLENAIWNEFGTGQYALHGDGRKTPWKYVDQHDHGWSTHGKRPQRTLHNTLETMKPKIQKLFEDALKGVLK